MTVRRTIFSVFSVLALAALLGSTGCNDRHTLPTLVETEEPFYVQGMQLKKQGRQPEALAAFLKVIDKRGSRAAPESHLDAGLIYLTHIKDPLEACHHFRQYLDLKPNSKEAIFVRGKVEDAKREFSRTLPGRPMEDQSVRLQAEDDLARLRRENEELRAELATVRGGGATQLSRQPRIITVPDEVLTSRPPPPANGVIEPANSPRLPGVGVAPEPKPIQATPPSGTKTVTPARLPTASGRSHTVKPKETLFAISRQYGVTVPDLLAANRNAVPSVNTPLRPGMVLKIP